MKALNTELKSLFLEVWIRAFSDDKIDDPEYRGDRLAMLSAALDPQTWCLDLYLNSDLAARVRVQLKVEFDAEYTRRAVDAPSPEGFQISFLF